MTNRLIEHDLSDQQSGTSKGQNGVLQVTDDSTMITFSFAAEARDLESVEYSFFVNTPRSTLIRSGRTC